MRKRNKHFSLIMAIAFMMTITFGFNLPQAEANAITDIEDHWAKSEIVTLVEKGVVTGYSDGSFKPDNTITRAEFMTLCNRAFSYDTKAEVTYTDVKSSDWFYEEVAKAKAAGYISGYEDGTMKPNNQISRQEAATIVANIKNLDIAVDEATLGKFTDAATIPTWSRAYVSSVVTAGFIAGYPDKTFKATNSITRAEAVIVLSKAMVYVTPVIPEVDYSSIDKAGTYGPATGTQTIKSNVTISSEGVVLQNTTIEGNLNITEAVGQGDVTLKNVKVTGTTTIKGGGENSVYLEKTQLAKVIVNKSDGKIRIVLSKDS
ncbi:MAG TPA: S-layer homology domain-containing protein, partial [Syntrophomonadaceae bacterium]|nr:S-layer homology domain-containing protein [Syntrophomonadaceae bacterium]